MLRLLRASPKLKPSAKSSHPLIRDLAEFLLASREGAILRMKVERSPAALDRFKDIVFETVFFKPNARSK